MARGGPVSTRSMITRYSSRIDNIICDREEVVKMKISGVHAGARRMIVLYDVYMCSAKSGLETAKQWAIGGWWYTGDWERGMHEDNGGC